MPKIKREPIERSLTSWELIFRQSKVNGADYRGEQLPARKVNWPKETWFRRRLREKGEETNG